MEIKDLRISDAARVLLEESGNTTAVRGWAFAPTPWSPPSPTRQDSVSYEVCSVGLIRPPAGLALVLVGQGDQQHRALRLADEFAFAGEWARDVLAWHDHGDWVPCPVCGAALAWHEAGYVPGWRRCEYGHFAQLADDGRSAEVR